MDVHPGLKKAELRIKIGTYDFDIQSVACKLCCFESNNICFRIFFSMSENTELLPELTLVRMMELTPHEIARNIHAHPTLSEAIMEAAHAATGEAIHT